MSSEIKWGLDLMWLHCGWDDFYIFEINTLFGVSESFDKSICAVVYGDNFTLNFYFV